MIMPKVIREYLLRFPGDMFGYATALRSFTQGRGIYTMQFFGYSEVPKQLYNELVENHQKKRRKWLKKNLNGINSR